MWKQYIAIILFHQLLKHKLKLCDICLHLKTAYHSAVTAKRAHLKTVSCKETRCGGDNRGKRINYIRDFRHWQRFRPSWPTDFEVSINFIYSKVSSKLSATMPIGSFLSNFFCLLLSSMNFGKYNANFHCELNYYNCFRGKTPKRSETVESRPVKN